MNHNNRRWNIADLTVHIRRQAKELISASEMRDYKGQLAQAQLIQQNATKLIDLLMEEIYENKENS